MICSGDRAENGFDYGWPAVDMKFQYILACDCFWGREVEDEGTGVENGVCGRWLVGVVEGSQCGEAWSGEGRLRTERFIDLHAQSDQHKLL